MKHLPMIGTAVIMIGAVGFTTTRIMASQSAMSDRWLNQPESYPGQVMEVIAGDLLQVRLKHGNETIQLCGIHAPASTSSAEQAKALTERLVDEADDQVLLLPFRRDTEGHVVAEVFVVLGDQEKLVQAELLLAGLASTTPQVERECLNGEVMVRVEKQAQE